MKDKDIDDILQKFEKQEYPLVPVLENDIDYSDNIKLLEKITENVNFEYLTNDLGLIKRVDNVKAEFALYSLTSKGRSVLRQGGWLKYLEKQEKIEIRKERKEDYELRITEFQAKNQYLPYIVSICGVIISFFAFINSCRSEAEISPKQNYNELYILKDTVLQRNHNLEADTISIKKQ